MDDAGVYAWMFHAAEFLFLINCKKRIFSKSSTNREKEPHEVREPQFGHVC
jgi:hypothetical protein